MSRSADDFRRIYGSPERREWVGNQPCVVCGVRLCVNAHTRTGGTGRKADYWTIIPLCHWHHAESHQGVKTFSAKYNLDLAVEAQLTQYRWTSYTQHSTEARS